MKKKKGKIKINMKQDFILFIIIAIIVVTVIRFKQKQNITSENLTEQTMIENEEVSTESQENKKDLVLEQKLQSGKILGEEGLPVLMYHFFYDKSKDSGKDGNWIEISDFEEQMKYLAENDFYFPTWEQVENYIDGKQDLPEKSVVNILVWK